MAGVETVVPFFGDDQHRLANLETVLDHLRAGDGVDSCYPLWVQEADSQAEARNIGAECCCGPVIYFNDADSLVPFENIVEAVTQAALEPGLVFAFTHYVRLDRDGEPYAYIASSASSGAVAISRECFEEVGGYDERFQGWGYEDLDFARRCAERWPVRRVEGELRHLWHPPAGGRREEERDLPVTHEQQKNLQLYESLGRLG